MNPKGPNAGWRAPTKTIIYSKLSRIESSDSRLPEKAGLETGELKKAIEIFQTKIPKSQGKPFGATRHPRSKAVESGHALNCSCARKSAIDQ